MAHLVDSNLVNGLFELECVLAEKDNLPWDMSVSESPELSGRAVWALSTDPNIMDRTGEILIVAELARDYGFTDLDGTTPASLRTLTKKPSK